jgi:Xaa-Pro aminopeptidase
VSGEAGSIFEQRAERLETLLTEQGLDLLLVTDLVNVRYLCGFTGTNGLCLLGATVRAFVTDFRYVDRAEAEVPDFERVRGERDLLEDAARLIERSAGAGGARVGFDDDELSVKRHAKLRELLPEPIELVPAGGVVERLRRVKDADEIELMRRAAEIANGLYGWLIAEHGLAGHTEAAVARALERRAQDVGADEASFPPIVAAAANGALPHAAARDVEIPRDTLVVVDLGCRVDGYCSDCTRTFATGVLDDDAQEVYELVRSAQAAAMEAVRPGAEARGVDAIARDLIDAGGYGDRFGHGLGHGVGLEVHEEPRLAPSADGTLEERNVVTVEPGVYLPGRLGVRIEDLVVVTASGAERLTDPPRELLTL